MPFASSIVFFQKRNANITGIQAPYSYLSFELQQESDSMVIITEIDPLDVAEILGQVGGFWDLILIIWPIVFVAASYEAPHLKPRNFRKSVMRVTETATKVLPARVQGSTSFTLEGRMRSQIDTYQEEDLSTWGREAGSSSHQQVNRGGREGWRLCSASHVILRLPGSSIFSFQQVITSTI